MSKDTKKRREILANVEKAVADESHASDCASRMHTASECTCGLADRLAAQEANSWYEANMGNDHQGLVISESDGANIAVVYDKKNAPLIAAAPELLAALKLVVNSEYDRDDESRNFEQSTLDEFESVIAKAEGK